MTDKLNERIKCTICQEPFRTAMILVCSHNFCSLCIRRALHFKKECPQCRQKADPNDLRNNRLLDEIIRLWESVRSEIQTPASIAARTNEGPQNTQTQSTTSLSTCGQPSPKSADVTCRSSSKNVAKSDTPSISQIANLFSNTSTSTSRKRFGGSTFVRQKKGKRKSVNPMMKFFSTSNKKAKVKPHSAKEPVECPICQSRISAKLINQHLDVCIGKKEERHLNKASNKNSTCEPKPKPKPKPLAQVCYTLMSDKDLRELNKNCGLSAQGHKHALSRRHREYIIRHNAECDALQPIADEDIIKEINKNDNSKHKERFFQKKKITNQTHEKHARRLIKQYKRRVKKRPSVVPCSAAQMSQTKQPKSPEARNTAAPLNTDVLNLVGTELSANLRSNSFAKAPLKLKLGNSPNHEPFPESNNLCSVSSTTDTISGSASRSMTTDSKSHDTSVDLETNDIAMHLGPELAGNTSTAEKTSASENACVGVGGETRTSVAISASVLPSNCSNQHSADNIGSPECTTLNGFRMASAVLSNDLTPPQTNMCIAASQSSDMSLSSDENVDGNSDMTSFDSLLEGIDFDYDLKGASKSSIS